MNEQPIDYTSSGFLLPIVRGNSIVYASINRIMYPEDDGLDFTGNYFIYLLHPGKGSTHFTLEFDAEVERWITRDAADWVENDLVNEIADHIESQKIASL